VPTANPGHSITIRIDAPPTRCATGQLTAAIAASGGVLTALDVVENDLDRIVVDVTVDAIDVAHGDLVVGDLRKLNGVAVRTVSDRTVLVHLGGKIEMRPTVPLRHRDDLARAYTPGVARICMAIAKNPADARRLTIKRNTVAVVTDGSAVLGLGNLGPTAALPVMEGKAALFKHFADVDAWPVCLDTQDTDKIVDVVCALAPVYGAVNLEDIAAPRCFEIERRLRDRLNIPVFHDDQHGTAIAVLAAMTNALRVVDKQLASTRIVVCGVGAAGSAIIRLLHTQGAHDIVAVDSNGILPIVSFDCDNTRRWIIDNTNPRRLQGALADALDHADVFIGVSAGNILRGTDIARMAERPIVFALANPTPEIDPDDAHAHAAIVATGRSDYPNQINNVLAFPGFFRGLLDADATRVTDAMLVAAATAIADAVEPKELNERFIVPSVFNSLVAPAVAAAVTAAWTRRETEPSPPDQQWTQARPGQ
jgi:malate dehydrogenase (oxaloacetate-decarboxylating)